VSNRAYLYSLSNRPKSYADRPDTISGLSEFPYFVPFSYRLLMSGDPQLCASLVADGFESDTADKKTTLYAISSNFEAGFARLQRFFAVLRPIAAVASPRLTAYINETITFLEAHRDRYLLLETIELDTMEEAEESALRACVEKEIENCLRVGAAVDALPDDLEEAAELLKKATQSSLEAPFDAFYGLRLDDDCDNTRFDKTEYPLGLEWSDVLYFELMNRSKFAASQRTPLPTTKTERLGPDAEHILHTQREAFTKGLLAIDKILDLIADITKKFPKLSYDTSKLKALRANYVRGLEQLEAGVIDGKARDGTSEIIREAREWIDSAITQIQQPRQPDAPPVHGRVLPTSTKPSEPKLPHSTATDSPRLVDRLAQFLHRLRNLFK
jgi:hypothetical protein